MSSQNNYPKLHNAAWPGIVGKGPESEPPIDLDTMLNLTAAADVNGVKFDGIDLFLFEPHVHIDSSDDDLKRLADKVRSKNLVVGSVVAPVWPPTGGGSAMGSEEERKKFVGQVRKACRIGQRLRELDIRPYGIIRIDSASSASDWAQDPEENQKRIAHTFHEACDVAESFGERLAAEGEICWGGMHSWKKMVNLLEMVDRPNALGFQADMAHTLLYTMGYNAPEDAILPQNWDWSDPAKLDDALKTLTVALRPWTIDFHVAQNDATVKGSGSHDKTGRHCLAKDPNGKLDIPHHAGYWLRDESGRPTKAFRHICWDGCMFPNEVMMMPQTWNDILGVMVDVRNAHGWRENGAPLAGTAGEDAGVTVKKVTKPAAKKAARKPAKRTGKKPAKAKPAKRAAKGRARKIVPKKVAKVSGKKPAMKAKRPKVAKVSAKKPATKAKRRTTKKVAKKGRR